MEDTYVYVSVKLYLSEGQTEESIQEVVSECDYSFTHDSIIDHEIIDITDFQIPGCFRNTEQQSLPFAQIDPYEILNDYNDLKNND